MSLDPSRRCRSSCRSRSTVRSLNATLNATRYCSRLQRVMLAFVKALECLVCVFSPLISLHVLANESKKLSIQIRILKQVQNAELRRQADTQALLSSFIGSHQGQSLLMSDGLPPVPLSPTTPTTPDLLPPLTSLPLSLTPPSAPPPPPPRPPAQTPPLPYAPRPPHLPYPSPPSHHPDPHNCPHPPARD